MSRIVGKITRALSASVVLVGASLLPAGAGPAAWAMPATIQIAGHGWGHGVGMGQYGALGYAQAGWSYQKILAWYYGGTVPATTSVPSVTVHLSELDNVSSLSVQLAPGSPSGSRLVVDGAPRTGTTTTVARASSDQTVSATNGAELAVGGSWSNGPTRIFAGTIVVKASPAQVWNIVPLQQYVEGVVPRESPASWPQAALEAQAVAARSYALASTNNGAEPICDTSACQVYGGDPSQYAGGDSASSNAAVVATANEVLECGSDSACGAPTQIALTQYSSSTGGYTAGGMFPVVADAGDSTPSNPNHDWTASIPAASVQAAFPSIGTLQSLMVSSRNGYGDYGGRVLDIVVTGSERTETVSGEQFASAVGLRSDWFSIESGDPSGSDGGYWIVTSDGVVHPFGDAPDYGSMTGRTLDAPVIGMAPTGDGAGYWLVASDGGIFSFGDAHFYGSTGGMRLDAPVIGMAPTGGGAGYWLVASDGGIFSFGDAHFYGSTGGMRLAKPVVAMAPTPDGRGYWLVASDGGVFTFGDAGYYGSAASLPLAAPIVGIVPTSDGRGYWLVASDGGIFTFGDAGFVGSLGGEGVTDAASVAPTPDGRGYLIVTRSGQVYAFGDATNLGDLATGTSGVQAQALGIFTRS